MYKLSYLYNNVPRQYTSKPVNTKHDLKKSVLTYATLRQCRNQSCTLCMHESRISYSWLVSSPAAIMMHSLRMPKMWPKTTNFPKHTSMGSFAMISPIGNITTNETLKMPLSAGLRGYPPDDPLSDCGFCSSGLFGNVGYIEVFKS